MESFENFDLSTVWNVSTASSSNHHRFSIESNASESASTLNYSFSNDSLQLGDTAGPTSMVSVSDRPVAEAGKSTDDGTTTIQMVFLGVLLATLVAVTVAGNLLVCVTILTDRKLRTPTNYFLLSLAVADMMLGVFVLPVSSYATLTAGQPWPLGSTLCNLYMSADVTLCTTSIVVLFSISVDRFLAIRFPFRYDQFVNRRVVWKTNAAIWAFATIVGVAPIHLGWNTVDGRVQNVARPERCEFELNAGYALLIGIGTYFGPLVIMCTVYANILQITRRQVKAIRQFGGTGNYVSTTSPAANKRLSSSVGRYGNGGDSDANDTMSIVSVTAAPLSSVCDSKSRSSLSRRKLQSEVVSDRKAVVTLASVVAAFAVCWVPYFVLFVLKPFLGSPIDERLDQLALWLGYVNSGVNPFLYAFHSSSFRGGFRRVLCRRHHHHHHHSLNHFRTPLASMSTVRSHRVGSNGLDGSAISFTTATGRLGAITSMPEEASFVDATGPR